MNGLFSLLMNNFLTFITNNLTTSTLAIICISSVGFLTILCSILALAKAKYTLLRRLWVALDFVGICLIEYWLEMLIDKSVSYLILTVGSCFLGLSICLFLPAREGEISMEKRLLAQFLDRCANSQNITKIDKKTMANSLENQSEITPSKVFSSPIINARENGKVNHDYNNGTKNEEIDFSHIKGILNRLEYYPLKEQDKKSASELEKAILYAEENGLDNRLKQTINEGLGALLKIMAKYAV